VARTSSALVELVASRSHALLRTAYLLTGDRSLAEDLVQEALAKVYRRQERIRDVRALESYVRTTMLRTAISWSRLRSSTEVVMAELPDRRASEPSAPDDRLGLWPLLQLLPVQQRAVIVLAYYEDLSETDIADTLGCSVGAVKSHRARALKRLRSAMGTAELSGTEGLS